MNEQDLINAFAAGTAVLSAGTIGYICYLASKDKDFRFLGFALLGLLVMAWFAAGYTGIVVGVAINTALYFRPVFPFLAGLFTWAVVIAWQHREYQKVARDIKKNLEKIHDAQAVIEKWEVG